MQNLAFNLNASLSLSLSALVHKRPSPGWLSGPTLKCLLFAPKTPSRRNNSARSRSTSVIDGCLPFGRVRARIFPYRIFCASFERGSYICAFVRSRKNELSIVPGIRIATRAFSYCCSEERERERVLHPGLNC